MDLTVRLPIELGQLLKLSGAAESGAHARELIQSGEVRVNGKVNTHRSHRLNNDDVVRVGNTTIRVKGA